MLSPWLPKGKVLTPQQLLGISSDEKDVSKKRHPRNEKEFQEYKKELKRIAKWHGQVYKAVRKGWKESTTVKNANVFIMDEKSRET